MIEVKELIKIAGADNVSRKKAKLDEYSRDISFVNAVMPGYVVKPGNAADIEKLVKLANETATPLVPVSSGPPHFRGDTVPATGGAIIVDLSGMKRIIRVDRLNRVVMVEPGVTFGELIPAVNKAGLRLNMPLLPRPTKSVVGSMLEREPVIMPKYHWDISDPLICVEVVFGNGDTFRTGAAAGPGTIEEQWASGGAQKEAAGPSSASLYRVIQGAQGTMGIVTWASVRCEILPRVEQSFLVGSSDLDKILELARWLVRLRLGNECLVLNNVNLAAILAKKWREDYLQLRDSFSRWVLFYNIAGYEYFPEQRVKGQTKDVEDVARRIGLKPVPSIGQTSASELLEILRHPSTGLYWKLRYGGACQDLFFLSNCDRLPELVQVMSDTATKKGYPASDIGVYIQPIVQGSNYHCEFNLFYHLENQSESSRIKELSADAIKALLAKGAFFSRPYGENASMIINKDAATVMALRKIKAMLDPNHVMNPGKLCF